MKGFVVFINNRGLSEWSDEKQRFYAGGKSMTMFATRKEANLAVKLSVWNWTADNAPPKNWNYTIRQLKVTLAEVVKVKSRITAGATDE